MKFDISTFTYDKEWLQVAIADEEEHGVDVEAGSWLKGRSPILPPSPAQVHRMMKQVRLHSIVFSELHQWMEGWNLGSALEDALVCARLQVSHYLHALSEEDWVYFDALLVEDEQCCQSNDSTPGNSSHRPLRNQLITRLKDALTPDAWNAIAQVAGEAMRRQVQEYASSSRSMAQS
jgi:hypothetical protein